MKCKIKNCRSVATFKSQQVCQKHYFRFMRNGSYELVQKKRKPRRENPKGYQLLYLPDHQLAHTAGYVYEHRAVIYGIYGDNIPDCELCGKETSWAPYETHIDHIDENVRNNNPTNLRVLCNACNVGRGRGEGKDRVNATSLTYDGETKTPTEWARDARILVCGATIRRRKQSGMTDEEALFTQAKTRSREHYKSKCKELEQDLAA